MPVAELSDPGRALPAAHQLAPPHPSPGRPHRYDAPGSRGDLSAADRGLRGAPRRRGTAHRRHRGRRRAPDAPGRWPMSASRQQAPNLRAASSVLPDRVKEGGRAVLAPVVRLAMALHLTPNTITVIGLGITLVASVLVATGWLLVGAADPHRRIAARRRRRGAGPRHRRRHPFGASWTRPSTGRRGDPVHRHRRLVPHPPRTPSGRSWPSWWRWPARSWSATRTPGQRASG
jgi:hypothetical protein